MATERIVFFDGRDVACCSGMSLAPTPVRKRGIIMDREMPWEAGGVSVFAASVVELDDGCFRMYYYTHDRNPVAMRIMIAESGDGFRWERRMLGQRQREGRDTNIIVIKGLYEGANVTQPSVVRLPDGRWRMYCWLHGQHRGLIRYIISDSEDGLSWETIGIDQPAVFHPSDLEVGQAGWTAGLTSADPKAKFDAERSWDFAEAKRLRSNDATNVYYDADRGVFEMLSVWLLPNGPETGRRTPHDNAPAVLRTIHRRLSDDGIHWGDPELVIVPGATDPLTQQFYYLSQHRQDGWRIGFLGNYHCWEQTMDLEMCFSRDGREWLRPLRGGFVPRGPIPEIDCMSAYATNALLPVANDEWLLLYRGGNSHHNHTLPEGVSESHHAVLGATWPRGRFAGLATAPNTIGRVLLKPLIQTGETITISADIRGQVRAELRDPIGGRLPGFELHASNPLAGDGAQLTLTWGEDAHTSACFRYDAVTLYLEAHDATIYSVNT